ncbi:MAG: hypothetical protein ACK559_18350, partial [bacterium]
MAALQVGHREARLELRLEGMVRQRRLQRPDRVADLRAPWQGRLERVRLDSGRGPSRAATARVGCGLLEGPCPSPPCPPLGPATCAGWAGPLPPSPCGRSASSRPGPCPAGPSASPSPCRCSCCASSRARR